MKELKATGNNLAQGINPDVKLYWDTLFFIMSDIFKTMNYRFSFYHAEKDQPTATIIRFCVEYHNDIFAVQDELFFPSENEGGQMNFEFTPQKFTKTPEALSKYFTRFVNEVKELVTVKGSFISVDGYRKMFESDGEKWVSVNKIKESFENFITMEEFNPKLHAEQSKARYERRDKLKLK